MEQQKEIHINPERLEGVCPIGTKMKIRQIQVHKKELPSVRRFVQEAILEKLDREGSL